MAEEQDERAQESAADEVTSESTAIGDDHRGTVEDARVERLLSHTIDLPILASAVEQQEAADAADTLEKLEDEEAVEVLEAMDDQLAAEALAEMETPLAVSVFDDVVEDDPGYAARLIGLMAPDDAADLLQALPPEGREAVLAVLPVSLALSLRRLVGYHEESAGGLMTTDFLSLDSGMTIAEATEAIRRREIPDQMQYLPVCDDQGRLAGVMSLREVLVAAETDVVGDRMAGPVRAVRVNTDRERVAREFDRYDHTLLPVVDNGDHLLGVVTVDDVIDIIRAEQTEDVQMTVGAGAVEALYSGRGVKFRGRFPWLGVSLVMTAVAAIVVLVF
jgi:magnesium transporter